MLAALTGRAATSATRILLVRRPGRLSPDAPRRWILAGLDGATRSGPWRHDDDLAAAAAALDGDQAAAGRSGPDPAGLHPRRSRHLLRAPGPPGGAAWPPHWPGAGLGVQPRRRRPIRTERASCCPTASTTATSIPRPPWHAVRRHLGGEVVVEHLRGMARFPPPVQAAAAAVFDRCGPLGARRRPRPLRAAGRAAPRARLGDVRRTGTGRRPIGAGRRPLGTPPGGPAHLPGRPGHTGHRVPGGGLRGPSRRSDPSLSGAAASPPTLVADDDSRRSVLMPTIKGKLVGALLSIVGRVHDQVQHRQSPQLTLRGPTRSSERDADDLVVVPARLGPAVGVAGRHPQRSVGRHHDAADPTVVIGEVRLGLPARCRPAARRTGTAPAGRR